MHVAPLAPQRGDLPPNRGQLFASYAQQLLAGEKQAGHDWYDPQAALLALAQLGYALQQRGESTVLPAAQLQNLLPQQVQRPGQRTPLVTPPAAVFELACRARLIMADPTAEKEAHKFSHQLLQEQFAAQHMLAQWQADDPALSTLWHTPRTRQDMPPANVGAWDPLPPPPPTDWEQTTILAAGLTPQPDAFVQAVLQLNPALAGRCLSEGRAAVSPETRKQVQQSLLADLGDNSLPRQTRIQAGRVLGQVGDPRFEPIQLNTLNTPVTLILPDLLEIAGGKATIGSRRWPLDRQAYSRERPQHQVVIAPFFLARTPLTNAEYACFINAGGYDQQSYWTPTGWQWRQGELEESGPLEEILEACHYYLKNPNRIKQDLKAEQMTPDDVTTWQTIIQLSEDEVRQQVAEAYAPQPHEHEQPYSWDDPAYNAANQPVLSVTWYEAMAYCAWLTEQLTLSSPLTTLGQPWANLDFRETLAVRLPTEAEWEWAAGGPTHNRYPWGRKFKGEQANTLEGRVLGTTLVGVYPAGAAACGGLDLSGNVWEWTHSLYRDYPYQSDDGREDSLAPGKRVLRGGSWYNGKNNVRVSSRLYLHPDYFSTYTGFRLVVAPVFS